MHAEPTDSNCLPSIHPSIPSVQKPFTRMVTELYYLPAMQIQQKTIAIRTPKATRFVLVLAFPPLLDSRIISIDTRQPPPLTPRTPPFPSLPKRSRMRNHTQPQPPSPPLPSLHRCLVHPFHPFHPFHPSHPIPNSQYLILASSSTHARNPSICIQKKSPSTFKPLLRTIHSISQLASTSGPVFFSAPFSLMNAMRS